MTMYRIQRSIAGDRQKWVRSDSYPGTYTWQDAEEIREFAHERGLIYRLKPVHDVAPVKTPRKPYRRHAAVTPLELRGAIAMLTQAMKFAVAIPEYDTYSILYDARIRVTRALEAL